MSFEKDKVIAGPCSAESREQVLNTIKELVSYGYTTIRAGVWKPRTKPGGFEGHGEKALIWLKEAKEKYGVKIATEVAKPDQLELAFKYGVDVFWIGARTTSDPFALQDIVDYVLKLKETDREKYKELCKKEFFIKNPISPDYELWEGAYLRLKKCNLNIVGVIHRGFKDYVRLKYRNNPIWEIPIKMKVNHPELKMYFDPSHISGNSKYIKDLIRQANTLHFDGYLVEVHYHPEDAMTDAPQQLTPKQLNDIFESLSKESRTKQKELSDEDQNLLREFRTEIDSIDNEILIAIGKRLSISEKIGDVKRRNNLSVFQNERFSSLLKVLKEKAVDLNIDPKLVDSIWFPIHQVSIEKQL